MMSHTGTLYYKAPEIFKNTGYSELIDMFSLGVMTYQLFCNSLPFYSVYVADTVKLLQKSEPTFAETKWKNASKESVDFISQLLVNNPLLRSTPAQCRQHDWLKNLKKTNIRTKTKSHFAKQHTSE